MLGEDEELTAALCAARTGDDAAFRTLFRALHPRLLGYVRTIVADPDAEDVAAETWLHIARDLHRFDGDADRFRGWTTRIARNRALDHLRSRARRPADPLDETALGEMPSRADTAEEAIAALGTTDTFALVGRLPREQAEAVVLRTVLGLDTARAAGVLGRRPGAVRTAAHRGLRRLAELLDARHPVPGAGPVAAGAVAAPVRRVAEYIQPTGERNRAPGERSHPHGERSHEPVAVAEQRRRAPRASPVEHLIGPVPAGYRTAPAYAPHPTDHPGHAPPSHPARPPHPPLPEQRRPPAAESGTRGHAARTEPSHGPTGESRPENTTCPS
ncbi:RNA polymerase sigma factor [Streptomyces lonarensis]|uniref:RNA polymerase sigma factor n=1 Tax=Streptomyces lonarensis TaxID=700599 RepID=A0A7X6HXX8_9ACTN|nr:RNA polymerase sigma factor [Streptomyces lonarensis]